MIASRLPQITPVNHDRSNARERDSESSLDNFGARYYAPLAGRFQSADLPFVDQHPDNPQSWNLYAYARNNPLSFTDPSGHFVQLVNGQVISKTVDGMDGFYFVEGSRESVEDQGKPANNQPETFDTSQKVNLLTVEEIANIVYNETASLTDSGEQNEPIDTARKYVAHAIMNADVQYGKERDQLAGTAPKTVKEAVKKTDAYKSSLEAAKTAFQEWKKGVDPTKGATHFNMRSNNSRGNFMKSEKNSGFSIRTQSGPFNNSYTQAGLPERGVYLNTYGTPPKRGDSAGT